MKNCLLSLLCVILTIACTTPTIQKNPAQVSLGTLERIPDFPSKYFDARTIDVWLPEGYDTSKKYAVLYMHDGQMLFDSTNTWNKQEWGVDDIMGKLIKEQKIKNSIVVGIWNDSKTRHSDYFPQKPFESLPKSLQDSLLNQVKRDEERDLFSIKVRSDLYLKFLIEELKPYIDQNYATLTDPNHTFIMGSSMGGLISMYALCEYPTVFGGAACLSTHWVGTFTAQNNPIPQEFIHYLDQNLPDPISHKLYFDYGTETLDALYEPFQLQVDSIMIKHGYNSKNWKTLQFEGHDHSENAWKSRLDQPIFFMLKK